MNNQDLQNFLNIIDGRIKKYINEKKVSKLYTGKITGYVTNNNKNLTTKYKVKLLGYEETEFVLLNKTGEILNIGDCVYIQTIGTDLNTGVIIIKTKESNNVVDYVVDQGSSGIWKYTKWNSGKVEFWGEFYAQNVALTTQGDGYYFSAQSIPLPFAVTSKPIAIMTGAVVGIWCTQYDKTNYNNIEFRIHSPVSITKNVAVRIYAWATWK